MKLTKGELQSCKESKPKFKSLTYAEAVGRATTAHIQILTTFNNCED